MKNILSSILILSFLFTQTLNAEGSGSGVPTNPAAAGVTPNDNGTVTPSQPPQQSDRKGGSGAAKAAAIAGAAMAGMSCIMMMNEARKMPPGSEKNMTMMMAMQQCAQAAQSAANAAKNDEAQKAVSQADTPKMAGFTAPKAPGESKTAENPALPTTEEKAAEEVAANTEIPLPGDIKEPVVPDPQVEGGFEGGDSGFAFKGVSISALKPIENSRVDVNESNKNDTPTITPPGMGGTGIFGGGQPVTANTLKTLSGNTDSSVAASGKNGPRGKGEEEALPSDGGGSSGSKEEGGNSAFDQLLSQMMGGAQPSDALSVGATASADLIALPRDKATGKGPNIFEYASYRYRVATYDESRVALKKERQANRSLTGTSPTRVALKND